jgi:hypothetical protein
VPTLRTPPARVPWADKLNANPFGFGLILHKVNELSVCPLMELFDWRRTFSNVLQVLERDILAVVCTCLVENPVSDLMEFVTEIP